MVTKNGYTLALQIQHLRSNIATIYEILVMNATLNVQSYRSTFGSQKETTKKKKSLVLNDKLLEKCFVLQKAIIVFKEKYFIINYPPENILLNKRSELISKCRHGNKNMLASIENSGKINNDSMDISLFGF